MVKHYLNKNWNEKGRFSWVLFFLYPKQATRWHSQPNKIVDFKCIKLGETLYQSSVILNRLYGIFIIFWLASHAYHNRHHNNQIEISKCLAIEFLTFLTKNMENFSFKCLAVFSLESSSRTRFFWDWEQLTLFLCWKWN